MTDTLALWLGAFVTLVVFSYLAKDNPAYRLVQQAALGVTVGMGIVIAWKQVLVPLWWQPITGALDGTRRWTDALWLLALVPGSLWYFQLSKRLFWVSTLISGLFLGVAAGLAFKSQILLILPQIGASLKPLNPFAGGGLTWAGVLGSLNNALFLAAMMAALFYFFFSVPTDRPVFRAPMRMGRVMLMICLGAMFGNTVMTRMAYLLERLEFLYSKWFLSLFSS